MLDQINLFKTAHAMARHAGSRQSVIAQNIAHADTPKYRAMDLPEFSVIQQKNVAAKTDLVATRASHLGGSQAGDTLTPIEVQRRSANPNQNGVSLQEELLFAVEAKRQHDRALAIYKSGLRILRSAISGK